MEHDECGCSGLLAGGVFNEYTENKSEQTMSDMRQFVAFSTYDEFKKANSAGLSGAYKVFNFDANWGQDEFEKHQKELQTKFGLTD